VVADLVADLVAKLGIDDRFVGDKSNADGGQSPETGSAGREITGQAWQIVGSGLHDRLTAADNGLDTDAR